MRNLLLILCALSLLMVGQVSAENRISKQVSSVQARQTPTGSQTLAQQYVVPAQQYSEFSPVVSSTAQPAVYDSPVTVYQSQPQQQYYYSQPRQVRSYYRPPVRQVNYNSIPITQRPNRPGHIYGNTVRFLYRLGR